MTHSQLEDSAKRSIAFIVAWGIALVAITLLPKDLATCGLMGAIAIECAKLAYCTWQGGKR